MRLELLSKAATEKFSLGEKRWSGGGEGEGHTIVKII
jgi:hypothetical protein